MIRPAFMSEFFFFFFWKSVFIWFLCFSSGSRALFMGPTNFFFNKTFIKNWFHCTFHIFKNCFTTVFSVFNKISNIQTHPKSLIIKICYNCTNIYFLHHLSK